MIRWSRRRKNANQRKSASRNTKHGSRKPAPKPRPSWKKGRRDADVLRHRIEEEAREEAAKTLERAKREIGIASETAIKQLYEVSGHLATDIAGRIVAREIKPEDHERLIQDAIGEIGQLEQ